MSQLEKKIDALMRLATAEDSETTRNTREEIRRLMQQTARETTSEDMISSILLELGSPNSLMGYPYLIYAIQLAANDYAYIQSITHRLYPALAEHFQSTPARVERAIRHLIEVTWMRGDTDVLDRYFGNTVSRSKGKPTNGEFIARIANVIKMRMKTAE